MFHFSQYSCQRGAALLYMLLIMGLGAASLLLKEFQAQNFQKEHDKQQLKLMSEAREALIGYALIHSRLPRPAGSIQNGHESETPCVANSDCSGFIPWRTLGIARSDVWGNLIRYSVTPEFTIEGFDPLQIVANKNIKTRDPKGQELNLVGTDHCSRSSLCSPAVIVATGRAGIAINITGVTRNYANRQAPDELNNFLGNNNFTKRPVTTNNKNREGEFDDIVDWVPLKLLYQRMSAAGTLH